MSRSGNHGRDASLECRFHGAQPYALLCCHLPHNHGLKYVRQIDEEGQPSQAWCVNCDDELQRARGWTAQATQMAAWKLFCQWCLEDTLREHELVEYVEGSDEP